MRHQPARGGGTQSHPRFWRGRRLASDDQHFGREGSGRLPRGDHDVGLPEEGIEHSAPGVEGVEITVLRVLDEGGFVHGGLVDGKERMEGV